MGFRGVADDVVSKPLPLSRFARSVPPGMQEHQNTQLLCLPRSVNFGRTGPRR